MDADPDMASLEDDVSDGTELPLEERRLVTQSYDLSVSTLIEQWNDGTLVLPEIQREYVWNNTKASRLIESLLLNVPIPVLYFAEAEGDQYEVIDGHQRVASIARFIGNEFALIGLRVLSDSAHRRKRFHQLPSADQRRIRTRVIRAIIITDESHPSMKFEVFERLNAGSIALNAQEIRNSTHRGPFMNMVKELVNDTSFRACIGSKKPRRRMVDNELIIRFLALHEQAADYRPPLPRFLNNFCAVKNTAQDAELDRLREVFGTATNNVERVYGSSAFRLTDREGQLQERNVNRALAETQLVTFARLDAKDVQRRKSALLSELGALHSDPGFLDDIQRATGDRARTLGRLRQYREAVERAGLTPNHG